MLELYGKGVSNGIAIGKLSFYSNSSDNVPKYSVTDASAELKRYKSALKSAKFHLQELYDEACKRVSKNESVIFQTHMMILDDSKFADTVENLILTKHLNAEFAVYDTALKIAEIFKSMDDEYLRQRYTDIMDAANTVIDILHPNTSNLNTDKTPVIIAASELLPSETISLNQNNLLGFVTTRGSRNSHTAILARTLGLPLITQVKSSLSRFDGMEAIIDGQSGRLVINPDHNTLAHYRAKQRHYEKQLRILKSQIGLPPVTMDGHKVSLSARVDNIDGIESALNSDAEGVGLFRTDYLFVKRKAPPGEEEQLSAYKTVLRSFIGKPVVICLANLSSEKSCDYLDIPQENNPAMGYRGIRVLLENKDFMMTQLRALYRASVYGDLSIILPLVNNTEEIEYVRRTIEEVKLELRSKGQEFRSDIKLGVLINTPAAALVSDEICRVSDFVSIGTNALTMYTLAMDRDNTKLEYFYEPYHKAVLRLIRFVCKNAHENGKKVSVCGGLASDSYITPTLLALGVDELIVMPSKVLDVKASVRGTDLNDAEELISKI